MEDKFFDELKKKAMEYFGGGGHGFDHVDRVYKNSLHISEGENVDMDVVRAAALLHDIARSIENEKDVCHADEGSKMAAEILKEMNFPEDKIDKVVHAIKVHRASKRLSAETREAELLQDADRLDAIGAISLTRVFAWNEKSGGTLHDPEIPPKEHYDGSSTTAINHLYEKILKIKPETFKTSKAKKMAEERYEYVKNFVNQFEKEWVGEL